MRFYIVDDDINIVRILTMIIEENGYYEVQGSSCDAKAALNDIFTLKPDIVLVDLLMPVMDGNTLVKKIKNLMPEICFIMISQVLDSDLRADSYKAGIEFFINKPINKIEVEKVISEVAKKIEMEKTIKNIKKMLKSPDTGQKDENIEMNKIKRMLAILGMLGEKGTNDIIKICMYLVENNKNIAEINLDDLGDYLGDNPLIVKQRIRRAIKKGLSNIANMGIENYSDDVFHNYGNVLFDFANIKAEMDYIKGKKKIGGNISINKFLDGLMLKCEDDSGTEY